MKPCTIAYGIAIMVALTCHHSVVSWAMDDSTMTVTKRGGTKFIFPTDWPTKKRGSAIVGVSLEEYLSGKFAEMNEQLHALQLKVTGLEDRVRKSEEDRKILQTRVQQLEGRGVPPLAQVIEGDIHADATKEHEAASRQEIDQAIKR